MSIWMPTCATCLQVCELGSSYIAVFEHEGDVVFAWGCEHRPIGDATAYLGSHGCALEWIAKHPRYEELKRRLRSFLMRRRSVTRCQLH